MKLIHYVLLYLATSKKLANSSVVFSEKVHELSSSI